MFFKEISHLQLEIYPLYEENFNPFLLQLPSLFREDYGVTREKGYGRRVFCQQSIKKSKPY
jgi:hypothetical protein